MTTHALHGIVSPGTWESPLITPDVPLAPERHRPHHPLRDLMAAILADAVAVAHWDSQTGQDARDWISRDDDDLFGFDSICGALGLHAGRVRSQVLRNAPMATAPTIVPAAPVRDYAPAAGCAICGWADVEGVCTDASQHNPCCVRRNPAGLRPVPRLVEKDHPQTCSQCGEKTLNHNRAVARGAMRTFCQPCNAKRLAERACERCERIGVPLDRYTRGQVARHRTVRLCSDCAAETHHSRFAVVVTESGRCTMQPGERRKRMLATMAEGATWTCADLQTATRWSKATTLRVLRELLSAGQVRRSGANADLRYEVIR